MSVHVAGTPSQNAYLNSEVYGAYILEVAQTALTGADVYFWYASSLPSLAMSDVRHFDLGSPVVMEI